MVTVSIVVDNGMGRECSIIEHMVGGQPSDQRVDRLLTAAVAAARRALELPAEPGAAP